MNDICGLKFGRLTAVNESVRGSRFWVCRCDCGSSVDVSKGHLTSGHTQSCGCLQRERCTKHGGCASNKKSRAYTSWEKMIQRCTNKNDQAFKYYGGRGIMVCDRWLNSFENFLADMGERGDGMTLDRIDTNGSYTKENCRWCSRKAQQNNRRVNHIVTVGPHSLTLSQWCDGVGIVSASLASVRISRGVDPVDAITIPSKRPDYRRKSSR